MLVNTLKHSSQADPVLYATNYPSKSRPILFAEWLGWDVRQSSNTRVPELYLLFEIVCNYGLVNGVQNEHKKWDYCQFLDLFGQLFMVACDS
jgi:hypothetical protein